MYSSRAEQRRRLGQIWTALAVATVFISAYVWSVADEARHMSEALSETQAALARAQGLAALDGLAAAAAHELGTPLATIAIVSNELSREIPAESPLAEDVKLLLSQSERCRDILADIAAEPEELGNMPFEDLPLSVFLQGVVDNTASGRVDVQVEIDKAVDHKEPHFGRRPEVIHSRFKTFVPLTYRKNVIFVEFPDRQICKTSPRFHGF